MRPAIDWAASKKDWAHAAVCVGNLSELELTLGEVAGALGDAEQSVSHADRSGDAFMRESTRTVSADALHQLGRRAEAEPRFCEAEEMQAERQSDYPLLYSLPGFRYCDLLLAAAERAAWQMTGSGGPRPPEGGDAHTATLQAVSERAAQTLKWYEKARGASLLDIALAHLTLGRAALYAAILESSSLGPCHTPSSTRWTGSAAPIVVTISLVHSSPAPGCAFSKAIAPAPRAREATWTRPGKSPSAAP